MQRMLRHSAVMVVTMLAIAFGYEKTENQRLQTNNAALKIYYERCIVDKTKEIRTLRREEERTQQYVLTVIEQIEPQTETRSY